MPLTIPLDLPNQPFSQQLERLERWACLPPGTLQNKLDVLSADWSRDSMVPVILEGVHHKAWDWPAYLEYVEQGGYQFSDDLITDMAEQVYDKFRLNRNALYRKQQLDALKEFRPFWQLCGCCAGRDRHDAKRVYLADDVCWSTACAPWNCANLGCRCRVYALTRTELVQYLADDGCADIAAAQLLKKLDEK